MEKLKVVEKKGKTTTTTDPRQIQRMNHHAEILFGKDHLYEPNFVAPMQPPAKDEEEELLGVEYAYMQSSKSAFSSKEYYKEKGEKYFHRSCVCRNIQNIYSKLELYTTSSLLHI